MAYTDIGAIQEGSGRDIGAIESEEVSGAAVLVGLPIAVSITVANPSIDLAANILVGSPISLSVTVPSPTIDAPVTFTGTSLALSVTVPAPGVELASNILSGAPIALSVTAVTPSVDLAANILAGTPIALSVAIATPSIDEGSGATLTLDPISLTPAIALSTIDAPVVLVLDPVTLSVTVVPPAFASAFAEVADTVREITAVSGKNQIIIITGPMALTAGDEIQVVGKVSAFDTSSEWLADETTISIMKV